MTREQAEKEYQEAREAYLIDNAAWLDRLNTAGDAVAPYWNLDDARTRHSFCMDKYGRLSSETKRAAAAIEDCLARLPK